MLFNSNIYLVFIFLVVFLYYQMSTLRQRQILLLICSYVFYWAWSFKYSILLLISTVVDYKVALWIEKADTLTKKRWILAISLICDLSLLAIFKYADFVSISLFDIFGVRPWPALNLILPLGISFYTFQIISYTIDVYRGVTPARRSILDVALFVSFFPHLIAGPIMRADQLMPELCQVHDFKWRNIRVGLARILCGMVKKVYIADSMALIVNEVYANPEASSGLGLALATYAFALQIYCDFSGYSDIALGSALLLGVHLPENFYSPYLSQSIREFWRRWHISLSRWLRDYLYVPLGGNRKGPVTTYINLMITMLIGGLWHGAGWNWVIWGGLQGLFMSVERFLGIKEEHPASWFLGLFRWFITFHLVCFSWIFFRSRSLGESEVVIKRIFSWAPGEYYGGFTPIIFLALLLIIENLDLKKHWLYAFEEKQPLLRWTIYASIVILAFTFHGATNPEFIYFQF